MPAPTLKPKKVLIVSPYFPPANTPDLHRIRMSVCHYEKNGWEPVVLAVRTDAIDTIVEPGLLATLPPKLRVVSVAPVSRRLSRFFGVGNIGWRGLISLFWRGCHLLREEKFDLVFFSTSQFAVFPLGRIWRELFSVPYVLDFQDAWLTDYYEGGRRDEAPGGRKYRWANLHARWCEGWSIRRASGLIAVSQRLLGTLVARYGMQLVPSQVIPFGASEQDRDVAAHLEVDSDATGLSAKGKARVIVSTGAVGSIMSDALQCLFQGFAEATQRSELMAKSWRFQFVGTSYAGPGKGERSARPIAEKVGIGPLVQEQTDRIGHLEALRWQQRADLLILLGSNDPAYVPSKLYPYLLSGRPVLAVVLRDSELKELLSKFAGVEVKYFSPGICTSGEVAALADFFMAAASRISAPSALAAGPSRLPRECASEFLTAQQCTVFNEAHANYLWSVVA